MLQLLTTAVVCVRSCVNAVIWSYHMQLSGRIWSYHIARHLHCSDLFAELSLPQQMTAAGEQLSGGVINATATSSTASRRRRGRREISPDKMYIETAVFADYMLYKALVGKTLLQDHDAFVKYVLAIVNTVIIIHSGTAGGVGAL